MTATGRLGYFPGAKGGKGPAFWDGNAWRRLGGSRELIETEGDGIWIVGFGASVGAAGEAGGLYCYSRDAVTWTFGDDKIMADIVGSAYANGMWVVGGVTAGGTGLATSSLDPSDFSSWLASPPDGVEAGTAAGTATAYDNDTGEFTIPFVGAGNQTVTNSIGAADPNDPSWPTQGVENELGLGFSSEPMPGIATGGVPMEVRISTKEIVIDSHSIIGDIQNRPGVPPDIEGGDIPFPSHYWGTWQSDYLEVRRMGSPIWSPPAGSIGLQLSASTVTAAGQSLKGLVWGVPRNAVEFAAGAT